MKTAFFNVLAYVLSRPVIANYLITRAQRTPYFHLDGYMRRYWLVPYANENVGEGCGPANPWHRPIAALFQAFDIGIRVHHILREDWADDMHDHPWDARTFVLRHFYIEKRHGNRWPIMRRAGSTATLNYGEYHKITHVPVGGVWTLFVTYKYRGSWGFLVNGIKVPHWDYTGRN